MTESPVQYVVLAQSISTDDLALVGPFGSDVAAAKARELVAKAIEGRVHTAPDATVTMQPIRAASALADFCADLRIALGPKWTGEGQGNGARRPPRAALPQPRAETGRTGEIHDAP